jgi:hypothetical protein
MLTKKVGNTLKNVEKNVGNTPEKCWRKNVDNILKNVDEKMFITFPKKVDEQNIYNSSNKKVKTCGYLRDLNLLSELFWAFLVFIVHTLIHLPVGT